MLSPEEVLRLLEAAPGPKHSVAYGAGLRAMEVVALRVCDVDSKRMMIRVEQGKGRASRIVAMGRHPKPFTRAVISQMLFLDP